MNPKFVSYFAQTADFHGQKNKYVARAKMKRLSGESLAKIVMRQKVDGQGFFRGKIAGVEGRDVLIDADDRRTHRVPLDVISRANLEVEF